MSGKTGLRVTGGEHRGRALSTPAGELLLRPMRSQVRQALFNSLAPWVPDATVLDLFAGSGCLGIEALSRGASRAVFVERAKPCLAATRANLRALGLDERGEVRAHDLNRGLSALVSAGPYDLVLVHPPFELMGEERPGRDPQALDVASLLEELATREGLLAADARVAIETPRGWFGAGAFRALEVARSKDYGSTTLLVLAAAEARS